MALKKSQLHSSLWQSCDELRGGMDASQYKDYVLTLLFMKYVSDKYAGVPNAVIEVPPGGAFSDMVQAKGDKEIGDQINKIIGRLAEANDLKGVIDQADFNDESKLGKGKEMQDRLSKLVAIFESLDFGRNLAGDDDLLGDAYEYLMMHFATESGKSKGQFYTPAEVSRILAQVVGIGPDTRPDQTIYDPACGSGSLLLKAADRAPGGITIYGQERENATWALARMNLFLHDHPTHELWSDNTLAAPHFRNPDGGLRRFDFAVANPPFSLKAWTNGLDPEHDEFGRFEYGVPPAKNGDYAFLLHLIRSLKSTGKGAIILPHGVLFRGNREAAIRRQLVRRGLIKGVIGLPPNLFYGTGIPACIVVIDKEHAGDRDGVFMVDASRGLRKDGPKNRLREQDIHRIVDVFKRQTAVPRYARLVPTEEIASPANDYNLNIPRYIDASEPEDLHDLESHLSGGIPDRDIEALSSSFDVFPSLRTALFEPGHRQGTSRLRVPTEQVQDTIAGHQEVRSFAERVATVFDGWRRAHERTLFRFGRGGQPKRLIKSLSEDLLGRFSDLPLLDPYDAYQRLMDFWIETMSDDVYLIASVGWRKAAQPRLIIEEKKKKFKETPDLTVGPTKKQKKYKTDLIPPGLVIARCFEEEQTVVANLQIRQDAASRELQEFVEEHSTANDGEEAPLATAVDDKGKVTKARVKELLRMLPDDPEWDDEREVLEHCVGLLDAASAAKTTLRRFQAALSEQVLARYSRLSEPEIKALVVQDKWLPRLRTDVEGEVRERTHRLSSRVTELEERYARPLPELESEVRSSARKVTEHLKRMGVQA